MATGSSPFYKVLLFYINTTRRDDTLKSVEQLRKETYEMYLELPLEDKLKVCEMLADLRRKRSLTQSHLPKDHQK